MSNSGTIFNVQGREYVLLYRTATHIDIFHSPAGLETTAANAQVEAPTSSVAREVEKNATHAKDVAHDAAASAKVSFKLPSRPYRDGPLCMQSMEASQTGNPPSALDQFQQQASKTLNAAVAQGQHDFGASTGAAEYVDQAKVLASSAISTAQVRQFLRKEIGIGFLTLYISRISQRASADRLKARTAILVTMSLPRSSPAPHQLWRRPKSIWRLCKKSHSRTSRTRRA
jgi:hypothetical protein